MYGLETLFALLSQCLLAPVLLAIGATLIYVIYACGTFCAEYVQRKMMLKNPHPLLLADDPASICSDDLEVRILKRLEILRLVCRTAPMLGLVATMIPLGPALSALGEGDLSAVGHDMALAFSAVIVALVASSGAYWISTIRRRWLLVELREFEQHQAITAQTTEGISA